MPQNEHIELYQKRHGKRLDHAERTRKKQAREAHTRALIARRSHGLRAKLLNERRRKEKIQMKKTIATQERKNKHSTEDSAKVLYLHIY